MNSGYIKVFRKLIDWEWADCPGMVSLFLHILLRANTEDMEWRGNIIRRGQLLASRRKLAQWCGLSERNVRTYLRRLQTTHEVTIQTTSKAANETTIITICKFEQYQEKRPSKRPTERPTERPSNRPPNDPLKEEYNKETSGLTNVSPDAKKVSEKFEKFTSWIAKHAPRVAAMKQPFTEEQFIELTSEFDAESVRDILEEMQNWAALPKRVSAFLTCRAWLRIRKGQTENKQPHETTLKHSRQSAEVSQYGGYGEGTI